MSNNRVISKAISKPSKISDYLMLTKFRLSLFVVISSVFAYLIATGLTASLPVALLLAFGGFCCTAASNAFNQVLERDFDRLMKRTENRPLAAERMRPSEAVLFGGLMLLIGILLLSMINPLTSLLTMFSVVLYSFVYTPMKRFTTLSVAIGAIPGSLPVLIGTTAGSGTITAIGIILFAIQFLWQFPHFWAIGYLSFDDYKKAGYKLLPMTLEGNIHPKLGLHTFVYALILIPISVTPFFYGGANMLIVLLILACSIIYAVVSYNFFQNQVRETALKVMFTSFFYLPAVLLLYMFI